MSISLNEILVVCDVDGTLLEAGYGLPKRNIDAIDSFTFKTGRFTLCTGRGIEAVAHYANLIKLTSPAVLSNGGMIYDFSAGKLLDETFLDKKVDGALHLIMSSFPSIGVEIMCGKRLYAVRMNEFVLNHAQQEHISVILTDEKLLPKDWNKIIFAANEKTIDEMNEFCEFTFRNDADFSDFVFLRTKDIYFEIIPANASKASGLVKLCEITGIPLAHTVAIGDYYNDIDLLDTAAFSIVVDGAPDLVKEHADVVVSACLKGGVADALKIVEEQKDNIFSKTTEE